MAISRADCARGYAVEVMRDKVMVWRGSVIAQITQNRPSPDRLIPSMFKNTPAPGPSSHAAAQAQFQQALALHQNGQLEKAQALYLQILRGQPKQFECLHLLGVIAFQTG